MAQLPDRDQTEILRRRGSLSDATANQVVAAQPPPPAGGMTPERIAELQGLGVISTEMAALAAKPPPAPAPPPPIPTATQAPFGAGPSASLPPPRMGPAVTTPPVAPMIPPPPRPMGFGSPDVAQGAGPTPQPTPEPGGFQAGAGRALSSFGKNLAGSGGPNPVQIQRLPRRPRPPSITPGFAASDRGMKMDIVPASDDQIGEALLSFMGKTDG